MSMGERKKADILQPSKAILGCLECLFAAMTMTFIDIEAVIIVVDLMRFQSVC
jgi:hypothetical protein